MVDWEDFPKGLEFVEDDMRALVHFRAWDITDAVEDAIYEHFEEDHPYWRLDYPQFGAYDPDEVLIQRRRRRVETVDLLARIPEGI